MKLTHLCSLLALAAGLALAPHAAHAQAQPFTIIFSPSTVTGTPDGMGGVIGSFDGMFTNNTGSDYYITGGNFGGNYGTDPRFTPIFNGDFNNISNDNGDPGTGAFEVLNGQTDTVAGVFTLSADPTVLPGPYNGTVDFQGESASDYATFQSTGTDNSQPLTTPTPLTLIVPSPAASAAPEPSQFAILGLTAFGALGLLLRAKRRKASSAL